MAGKIELTLTAYEMVQNRVCTVSTNNGGRLINGIPHERMRGTKRTKKRHYDKGKKKRKLPKRKGITGTLEPIKNSADPPGSTGQSQVDAPFWEEVVLPAISRASKLRGTPLTSRLRKPKTFGIRMEAQRDARSISITNLRFERKRCSP